MVTDLAIANELLERKEVFITHQQAQLEVFCFRRNWSFPQNVLAINKMRGGKHHVQEEKKFHA